MALRGPPWRGGAGHLRKSPRGVLSALGLRFAKDEASVFILSAERRLCTHAMARVMAERQALAAESEEARADYAALGFYPPHIVVSFDGTTYDEGEGGGGGARTCVAAPHVGLFKYDEAHEGMDGSSDDRIENKAHRDCVAWCQCQPSPATATASSHRHSNSI